MTDNTIEELDRSGLRHFAITFGGVVVALFGLLFPWLLGTDLPVWPWYLWLLMAAWGLAAPMTVRPFYIVWMKFGLLMGKITTPLVLGIIYYAVITPTGLIAGLFRDDPMKRNCAEAGDSFRIESTRKPREHMENPF
jgi:hypothetical protein